ncbi:hypothetical protein BSKO_10801 [Bryopsis sp. KO-2023]|nr:hypothetical protein BSKO_10801 [Bryopsis sp. KO-2023]
MSTVVGPLKSAGSPGGSETGDPDPPRRPNKETESEEEINGPEICPWSHMLKFHNEEYERHYAQSMLLSCAKTDRISAIIPLILTPVKCLTSDISHPWEFCLCMAVFYVAIPLFMLWLMTFNPNFYTRNRSLLPFLGRPIIATGCAAIMFYETLWIQPAPLQMLSNIATKSCIVPLITTTFGMRLPFSHHLTIQLISNLLSCFWVKGLDDVCMSDLDVAEGVNTLGYFTERLVVFPLGGPPLKSGQFSCRLVGLFYHSWLGFFVPTMLLYCIECWGRSSYLEHVSSSANQMLQVFRKASLLLAGLVFVVGTQLLWLGLKIWFDTIKSLNNDHGVCTEL